MSLAVINKIHWRVAHTSAAINKRRRVIYYRTLDMLTTLDAPAVIDSKAMQILVEKRDFYPTLGRLRRNIAITFGIWINYRVLLNGVVTRRWKNAGYDYSFWHNTQTWQTARRTDRRADTPHDGIERSGVARNLRDGVRIAFFYRFSAPTSWSKIATAVGFQFPSPLSALSEIVRMTIQAVIYS